MGAAHICWHLGLSDCLWKPPSMSPSFWKVPGINTYLLVLKQIGLLNPTSLVTFDLWRKMGKRRPAGWLSRFLAQNCWQGSRWKVGQEASVEECTGLPWGRASPLPWVRAGHWPQRGRGMTGKAKSDHKYLLFNVYLKKKKHTQIIVDITYVSPIFASLMNLKWHLILYYLNLAEC